MAAFFELAVLIGFASLVGALLFVFKQPTVVAYVLAGLVLGPLGLNAISDPVALESFSKLGIAFLLFLVGLELNLKSVREVGRAAVVTGFGQLLFCTALGFLIGRLLGFGEVASLLLGLSFAFSSTVVVVKLLSDKGELDSLHGRIAVGFLLVQDVVAIVALMLLSNKGIFSLGGLGAFEELGVLFLKLAVILLAVVAAGKFVVPRLARVFSRSTELIFLFAISWCFLLAAVFELLGFSVEIGALMAGVSLSGTLFVREIASKVKPLRDLFIVLFFLFLGSQLELTASSSILVPALIYSLFILITTPLVVMLLMKALHFSKRTGFILGVAVSQVSEFSLLLLFLAFKQGLVSREVVGVGTLTGVITIIVSTYLISHSDSIYRKVGHLRLFKFFEENQKTFSSKCKESEIFIIGCGRTGKEIIPSIDISKTTVIDFDPQVLTSLSKKGVNTLYGDVGDFEFLKSLNFKKAKIVISTTLSKEANTLLLREVKQQRKTALVILTADNAHAAIDLYNNGADYVILPHFISGSHAAMIVEKCQASSSSSSSNAHLNKQRELHKKELLQIAKT